jgi:hypothetical protein
MLTSDMPVTCPRCDGDLVSKFCATCAGRAPQRWEDGVAVCCDWEMVTLPGPGTVTVPPGDPVVCEHCRQTLAMPVSR